MAAQVLVRRVPQDPGILLLSIEQFTQEERSLTGGRSRADFTQVARQADRKVVWRLGRCC